MCLSITGALKYQMLSFIRTHIALVNTICFHHIYRKVGKPYEKDALFLGKQSFGRALQKPSISNKTALSMSTLFLVTGLCTTNFEGQKLLSFSESHLKTTICTIRKINKEYLEIWLSNVLQSLSNSNDAVLLSKFSVSYKLLSHLHQIE